LGYTSPFCHTDDIASQLSGEPLSTQLVRYQAIACRSAANIGRQRRSFSIFCSLREKNDLQGCQPYKSAQSASLPAAANAALDKGCNVWRGGFRERTRKGMADFPESFST
jgi:hypothetical protein